MKYDFGIITQCRYNSTRLPGKILLTPNKNTRQNYLEIFVKNLKKIKKVDKIVIASSNRKKNIFIDIAKKNDVLFFSSKKIKETNVLERYYKAAKKYNIKNIIRITSDCPFINPWLVDKMLLEYKKKRLDFLTNNKPRHIPHGFDCEIFNFDLLEDAYYSTNIDSDLEHVTKWIYRKKKSQIKNFKIFKKDYSNIRLTLDTIKDHNFFIQNLHLLKKISKYKNPEKILKLL